MNKTDNVLSVLKGARFYLSDEANWAQGVGAEDAEGWEVHATDASACKRCLTAAVSYAAYNLLASKQDDLDNLEHLPFSHDALGVLDSVDKGPPTGMTTVRERVVERNDHYATEHDDILRWLDDAIRAREQEAQK